MVSDKCETVRVGSVRGVSRGVSNRVGTVRFGSVRFGSVRGVSGVSGVSTVRVSADRFESSVLHGELGSTQEELIAVLHIFLNN